MCLCDFVSVHFIKQLHVFNSFWTGSLKQTIWTKQNEGLPNASGVLLMHKLVWDCFYVDLLAHASVCVCRLLQPLWTIWPRTWVYRLREGWSWVIIRQCWDSSRWRQDRLTESNTPSHTFTHLLRPAGALYRVSRHKRREVFLWFPRQDSCHSIWRDLLVILGLSWTSNSDKRTSSTDSKNAFPAIFQNVLSPCCA